MLKKGIKILMSRIQLLENLNISRGNVIITYNYFLVKNIGFDGSGTHNKNVGNTHSHSSIENIKINVEKLKLRKI